MFYHCESNRSESTCYGDVNLKFKRIIVEAIELYWFITNKSPQRIEVQGKTSVLVGWNLVEWIKIDEWNVNIILVNDVITY